MIISKMTPEESGQLLARVGIGRLACVRSKQPYVVPIYFAYEAGRLYSFATVGRKIDWMRLNPLVCAQADEVMSQNRWMSVVVNGRYEEIPDGSEHAAHARSLLEKRYFWWQTGYAVYQARDQSKPISLVMYSIHVDEMTGLRASPDQYEQAVEAGFG